MGTLLWILAIILYIIIGALTTRYFEIIKDYDWQTEPDEIGWMLGIIWPISWLIYTIGAGISKLYRYIFRD